MHAAANSRVLGKTMWAMLSQAWPTSKLLRRRLSASFLLLRVHQVLEHSMTPSTLVASVASLPPYTVQVLLPSEIDAFFTLTV